MNPFWVVSNSFNSRYAPYRSSSPIAIYNKGGVDINSRWIVVSCWQSVVMLVCKIPIVLIRSIVKIVLSFNNSESSFCMCGLYIPINVDNCLQTSISDSAAFSEEGRHLWVISSSSTNRSGNCRVRDRYLHGSKTVRLLVHDLLLHYLWWVVIMRSILILRSSQYSSPYFMALSSQFKFHPTENYLYQSPLLQEWVLCCAG